MFCFMTPKGIGWTQTASLCCGQRLLSHCIAVVISAISFPEIWLTWFEFRHSEMIDDRKDYFWGMGF
jgi:hypothetical protein